jgi:FkbM family methyltransferase
MTKLFKNIFRKVHYSIYGKSGQEIMINNELYKVSAHVSRGIVSNIDEIPLKLLLNFCVDKNTVFDIGGNIGVVAIILSKRMKKDSTIYSFEPAPSSFKYLADMARVQNGNSKIIPINSAVSNNNEKLCFTNDGNSCTNHILDHNEANSISVDSITIDEFCVKNNVIPQLIKIDVEGAEFWALEGMKQTLTDNNCIVLIEIHREFLVEHHIDGKMFSAIINTIGYRTFDCFGNEISSEDVMKHSCVIISKEILPKKIFEI